MILVTILPRGKLEVYDTFDNEKIRGSSQGKHNILPQYNTQIAFLSLT